MKILKSNRFDEKLRRKFHKSVLLRFVAYRLLSFTNTVEWRGHQNGRHVDDVAERQTDGHRVGRLISPSACGQ